MKVRNIWQKKTSSSKRNISTHITKFNPSSSIIFGNFHHQDKCNIICNKLIKHGIKCPTKFKQGLKTIHTNRLSGRHWISFQKTWGYHYFSNDSSYITHEIFAQLIFSFPVMHNLLHNFLGLYLNHFTVILIVGEYIISLSNLIFKNPFIIASKVRNYGTAEFKVK